MVFVVKQSFKKSKRLLFYYLLSRHNKVKLERLLNFDLQQFSDLS